jgi:hypothetical protein
MHRPPLIFLTDWADRSFPVRLLIASSACMLRATGRAWLSHGSTRCRTERWCLLVRGLSRGKHGFRLDYLRRRRRAAQLQRQLQERAVWVARFIEDVALEVADLDHPVVVDKANPGPNATRKQ